MKRFKTEQEFIKEYGTNWRNIVSWNSSGEMDDALGEPFDKIGCELTIPRCKGYWVINKKMLTSELLLPIGTKVAIPLTYKNKGIEGSIVAKRAKDNILYYTGISGGYHCLSFDGLSMNSDHFYASEILEAYERYQREQLPRTPNKSFTYEFKVGDWAKIISGESNDSKELNGKLVHIKKISKNGGEYIEDYLDQFPECNHGGIWLSDLVPVTTEEIQEYLIKEAKKRYPIGTKYKNADGSQKFTVTSMNWINSESIDKVYGENNKGCLYYEGKWATIIESTKTKEEELLEEAKRRYPVGTKFRIAHAPSRIRTVKSHKEHKYSIVNVDGIHINFLIEENHECESASVYGEGKWAEIVSKPKTEPDDDTCKRCADIYYDGKVNTGPHNLCEGRHCEDMMEEELEDDCIAKKGEFVKIIDFGRATGSGFTLNKVYKLDKDLNKKNGFVTTEDDCGRRKNGWTNGFELGMKFEKVSTSFMGQNHMYDKFIDDLYKIEPVTLKSVSNIFNSDKLIEQLNKINTNEKSNKQKTNGETIKANRKITTVTESKGISGECISVKRRSPKITTGHLGNGTVIRGK